MKIVDEKLQRKIGFVPHINQQLILNSEARDIVVCAGRRFGKSAVAAYKALKVLLADNKRIAIISPTYDLSQRVFEYIQRWLYKGFPGVDDIATRPFPSIKTPWGSILECKSAENPTGILGQTYDLTIIDEASRIPRNVWEVYIFPTTSQGGKSFFISTPFGKNYFYERWVDAKESGGAFHFRSIDNPYIKREEWDRAKDKLPEQVFKQEYEAAFLDDAASVFRGIREIVNQNCLEEPKVGGNYLMGVDLGKHEDFTVITAIDRETHKVVYFDRFKDIQYPIQKTRIIAISKRYNDAQIVIDSTGLGDPITDDLRHDGRSVEDFKFSNRTKQQLVEKLSLFIEQKEVFIPPEQQLIDELEAFAYNLLDSGRIRYGAPQGLHDDCVVSLGLAVWLLRTLKESGGDVVIDNKEIGRQKEILTLKDVFDYQNDGDWRQF